jgi:hypothetical protein
VVESISRNLSWVSDTFADLFLLQMLSKVVFETRVLLHNLLDVINYPMRILSSLSGNLIKDPRCIFSGR